MMKKQRTKILSFRVVIEQDEEGYFIASAPAIPGCYTQGMRYEDVLKNIREAIQLCLDVAKDDPSYKKSIDFGEEASEHRFIGVTHIPIRAQLHP